MNTLVIGSQPLVSPDVRSATLGGVVSVFILTQTWHAALCPLLTVNKHKPWIETTYHGIVTENDDKVLLDPPLIALDKDAPLRYAGEDAVALNSLSVVSYYAVGF